MSDPFETMDPNLKEVLLDIAKDERSTLFRVEPREIAVGVMDDVPSLSAGTAGWTPAERHLLQAYREDVALLLQDAFRVRLTTDETGKEMFRFTDSVERRVSAGGSHLSVIANRLGRNAHSHDLSPEVQATLGEIATLSHSGPSSIGSLAHLAHRLVPSEVGLILVGISLVFEDQLDQAMALFQGHLETSVRSDMRRHSWANLGKAFTQNGESRKAYVAHMEARLGGPWTHVHAWNCFATALDCGDSDLIRESLEHIEARTSADPVAESQIYELAARIRGTGWSAREGFMAARAMRTHLSPEERGLIDALLK